VAPSRYQRTGQRTLHQDAETGAPTGIANTVPANKNDRPLVVRSGAPRCCGCKRISRKTYPFVRLADACVYRTHPQEQSRSQPLPHTVLSRKNIPYRPTNVCSLRQAPDATTKLLPTKDLQIMRFLRCLVSSKNIPYPATSFTVPRYKLYRTPLQALPYPATSFTVLTSKEYRTLPQNMTYPATKAARNVPAKLRKYVGERSERPVCVYC
jgi:hypothetical protein